MPRIASSIASMSGEISGDLHKASVREVVAGAKRGDVAAFGRLVDLYQQRAYRTARAILGSDSDARDAVQEVFFKAYRGISRFDESRDIAPWMHKITTNVCRDIASARRRHQGEPIEEHRLVSALPGPFESASRQEQRNLVRRTLACLPCKERAAITLRDLEGLTTREVARMLGTTEATVRSQVRSGRARLRLRIGGKHRRDT